MGPMGPWGPWAYGEEEGDGKGEGGDSIQCEIVHTLSSYTS